jgi:hypothetical protein
MRAIKFVAWPGVTVELLFLKNGALNWYPEISANPKPSKPLSKESRLSLMRRLPDPLILSASKM